MTEDEITAEIDDIMEQIDDLIDKPMGQEQAVEVLEEIEESIRARIAGIKADMGDGG
jgi:hypothetical protein